MSARWPATMSHDTLYGGGLQARMCLAIGGRGLCGLQERAISPFPWSVTCPVCKRYAEYQEAARLFTTCAAHDVPCLPDHPCPACASQPG